MNLIRRQFESLVSAKPGSSLGQLNGLIAAFLLLVLFGLPGQCREPWEMQQPPGPAPESPVMNNGAPPAFMGMVPTSKIDAAQAQLANRVPAGTILTGILEQDVSSDESKPNDVFTILLQDGVVLHGQTLLPPLSKILGSVVSATPAKLMGAGHPGQLQIALHQLVLPDGRSFPFYGFIARNPNHDYKERAKVDKPGHQISTDTGHMFSSFFGQFTAGVGSQMKIRNTGNDFEMAKGDVIPIRVNHSIDTTAINSGQSAYNPATGLPSSGVPGMANSTSGQGFGGGPAAQPQVPGLVDTPVSGDSPDPNNVFNQPVSPRPMADIPDPF